MVSSATQVSDRLTAAVWDFPPIGLRRFDPQAVDPVCVVVAPTALELHTQRAKAEPVALQPSSPSSLSHQVLGFTLLCRHSSYLMAGGL